MTGQAILEGGSDGQLAWRLGVALAVGLLVGLERAWTVRDAAPGSRVAGIRTFGLLGLVGGVASLLPIAAGAVIILAAACVMLTGYIRQSAAPGAASATAAVSGLITIATGFFAGLGQTTLALAVAATIMLLLSMRENLHRWVHGLEETELRAAARFGLIALVILPLLPDRSLGPLDAWNPRQLWMVVVLISGLSFMGYIAGRRVVARRAITLTAVFGAFVSSTAITAAYARQIAHVDSDRDALGGGILIASVVMQARVIGLVALLARPSLGTLVMALAAPMAISAIGAAILVWRGQGNAPPEPLRLGNPLELPVALGFAGLVALASLAGKWALGWAGELGIATVIALTGVADVDAAILALAALPAGALDVRIAGLVLAVPVLLNTAFKAAVAASLGGRRALPAAGLLAATALGGAAMVLVLR